MTESLFKKTVLAISVVGLMTVACASNESTSANATSASQITTALASAGIFVGAAGLTVGKSILKLGEYDITTKAQQYGLILIPAAFLTVGCIAYLFKSAKNWQAKLSSTIGFACLTFGGLLLGDTCVHPSIRSHKDATFVYTIVPLITAGTTLIGYALQPKHQVTSNDTH
jgi:hypothetical protein